MWLKVSPKLGMAKLFAAIMWFVFGAPLPAQAQSYRVNTGCPSLADLPANITADELRCRCYQICGGTVAPAAETAPAGALNCGQIGRIAQVIANTPEGQTAMAQFRLACGDQTPTYVPPATTSQELGGRYEFTRGYTRRKAGVNKKICALRYGTDAEGAYATIVNGKISFTSGGFDWTGVVTSNKWILISGEGMKPTPKTYTAIMGPIGNASLVSAYCGEGFFKLGKRL